MKIQSVVFVQPHPDDNEVGAAGTIAMLAERGCKVVFVTVTDGRLGTGDLQMDPNQLVEIRREERLQSGLKLGVSSQIELGFADGGDYSEREVMEALIPILRAEKPEMVITVDPWMPYEGHPDQPYEGHPDHYKTGRAVAASVLLSGHIGYPQAGAPISIPQIGFYATSYPNTFVDVTRNWERKLESILLHDSQFNNEEWQLLKEYFAYQGAWFGALKEHQDNEAVGTLLDLTREDSSQGYAEALKILSTKQLHFFPSAIFS